MKTRALSETDTPIRIVMGNTSGDMDSVVGALGLAYFLTLKTKEDWCPVINCASDDFNLKVEIFKHLIEDCKLNTNEHLLFWDQFVTLKRPLEEIALFDHNLIDGA
jgi:inorganic pyrophosphatase/exopolyphosphatase